MTAKKILFTLVLGVLLALQGIAQPGNDKSVAATKDNKATATNTIKEVPFAVGEQLNYEVSWSSFVVAGELTLETKARRTIDGVDAFHVSAQAQSVGIVSAVVYKVKDVYDSFLNARTLQPFRAEKNSRRGKKREQGTMILDQQNGKAKLEDGKEVKIPQGTYDLASLLYAIRMIDLTPGKTQNFTLIEDGKLYELTITVEGREKIGTRMGDFNTVRVSTKAASTNRSGKDPYQLKIYLTNDAQRLPVLMTASPAWGEVRVELTSAMGTKKREK
ncbi:MAG: DUF3108 domain-containing protein [Acidobacteriota bacterium]